MEVPVPVCREGGVLVQSLCSLISPGTEKSGLRLAQKTLLGKAASRPDLVKKVWQKVQTEGVLEAYRQALGRLDSPVPLGYSCSGVVIETGRGVDEFRQGDRVACFGSGWASHAEINFIPKNLCARIPPGVSDEEAAFAGVGAIALHGVRLLSAGLGDTVAVIGLGLLGLISVQLLKSSGARVVGYDPEMRKVELARELGADAAFTDEAEVREAVGEMTGGAGADAVIILAATDSLRPVEFGAELARERALIAVPGLVGLTLPRPLFYEKELRLVVPHSAGPGIDNIDYEERGREYPISHVRWSARRNLQSFLALSADGKIDLKRLITHCFPIAEALRAYEVISGRPENYVGIILSYPSGRPMEKKITLARSPRPSSSGKPGVGVGLIGAGLFARGTLLPAIKSIPWIRLKGLATATGSSGAHTGKKFGFDYCTTDYRELLSDPEIDCILIATRHNLHADLTIESLGHGKNVFVEKPLALNCKEISAIFRAYHDGHSRLMVGYNRRFSPFSRQAREWISGITGPLLINCRVNAGFVSPSSWVRNRLEGGGELSVKSDTS